MSKQQIQTQTKMTCHRPMRIRIDNHLQTVACGKCSSCRVSKIKRLISRIQQHGKRYEYIRFITLTYDPEHLPILDYSVGEQIPIIELNDFYYDSLGNIKYDSTEVKEVLFIPRGRDMTTRFRVGRKRANFTAEPFSYYLSTLTLEKFRRAQSAPLNTIYYAPSSDIQLFLKRLKHECTRIYKTDTHKSEIQQDPYNKTLHTSFSYYAIREFGERGKRPHWHLLLFFNSKYIAEHISDSVHKSWQYGINRTEVPRDSCASYVASYLQCSAIDFELFNRVPEIRPKRYASIDFGDDILPKRTTLDRFKEVADIAINGRTTTIDDHYVRVFPKWQDFSRLFFRPKNIGFSDPLFLHKLFRQAWYLSQDGESNSSINTNYSPIIDDNVSVNEISEHIINSELKKLYEYRDLSDIPNDFSFIKSPLYNLTPQTLLHYTDVQHTIFELFRISLSEIDYFKSAITNHPIYIKCVARLSRHLYKIRQTLLSWNIDNYNQLYTLSLLLTEFYKTTDYMKLLEEYRTMRDINNPEFTNFIYSLKYNAYGYTTESEIYEISSSIKTNSLFRDSSDQADQELEKIRSHKKIKHLMSNL